MAVKVNLWFVATKTKILKFYCTVLEKNVDDRNGNSKEHVLV